MTIHHSVQSILRLLEASITELTEEQFVQKIDTLSGATIGQHIRHILEMMVCLEEGYAYGTVNYEHRKRDIQIETQREIAIQTLHRILQNLHPQDKDLTLEAGFDELSDTPLLFQTNYYRELAYNLEHAIHHMALIKIGIRAVSTIELPKGYGVASSTIRYRENS
ncbi:MAG: hypothetical protein J0M30_06375 [Chitinophagales bacterium]|nr:hypothetical protein [Chitinophagales bacterium]